MTTKEIFELRRNGHIEEAYEAARRMYATDKSTYTAHAMFWTAVDILKVRIGEGRIEEATVIHLALQRLLLNVSDENGWMKDAFEHSGQLLEKAKSKKKHQKEKSEHTQLGIWGEELAVTYLSQKGYAIIERDWHSGHRDIDIIARDGDLIVFVEVKTRQSASFCDPMLSINWEKRRNLRYAINHYKQYRKIESPTRFDIIIVVGSLGCSNPIIEHVEDVNILELTK